MSGARNAAVRIPEWNDELVDAFDTEARQIETLVGVLQRQRDGIARDAIEPIQDSVSAIHRVLLTLDEARKRRRTLQEMVSEATEAGERKVGDPESIRVSRARLIQAARGLEAELSMNRNVLETALDSTDAEIRTVLGESESAPTYAIEPEPIHGAGRLVDRQI